MAYLYGDLNHKMVSKEYQGIDNETAKTIVDNENNTIEVLVDQRPIKDIYKKMQIALKFKADLEQPKYGEHHQLVVPYRELPPIVYLREDLPEAGDDAQPGVLYILKGDTGIEYTAYIWDLGIWNPETKSYGDYVELFTINYPDLKNRPSINDTVLDGKNYADSDLGLQYQITSERKLPSELVDFGEGKSIKEALQEEKRERVEGDNILQDHLDAEISARIRADLDAMARIAEEERARSEADTNLNNKLDAEITARETADTDLNTRLVKEISDREVADSTLNGLINLEKETRIAQDNELQNQINIEKQSRANADNDLSNRLNAEINNRGIADASLTDKIVHEAEVRLASDEDIRTQLKSESTKRANADSDLSNRINAEIEDRGIADASLTDKIIHESEVRLASDEDIRNQLKDESIRRANADNDLSNRLKAEITRATNSENTISNDLAQEIINRTNVDSELLTKLTTEIGNRTTGDENLSTRINTETSNRTNADDALQQSITAETQLRAQADNNLQSQIDTLNSEKINKSEKGAANGIATLDENNKVPAAQLPAFVDDVLEFANVESFPAIGESGKIYVALDTNKTYRWSGSTYVEISASLALGETSSTAYAGDKGKQIRDDLDAHLNNVSNPHAVTKEQIGLGNVDNTSDANKPISTAVQSALDAKQNTLTAGDNILIENNIIKTKGALLVNLYLNPMVQNETRGAYSDISITDIEAAYAEHRTIIGYFSGEVVFFNGTYFSNILYSGERTFASVKFTSKGNLDWECTYEYIDVDDAADVVAQSLQNHTNNNIVHITNAERDAWNAKYEKPSTGIAKTDLENSVQESLNKADTALQTHQDISGKQDTLTAGTNVSIVNNVISATDTTYTSGNGIDITSNQISIKLAPNSGLAFDENGCLKLDIPLANGQPFGGN